MTGGWNCGTNGGGVATGLEATAGAVPIVVLYPFLNVPVEQGPQRDALNRLGALLSAEEVVFVDITRLVHTNDRQFRANRFDPHPSALLHRAVVPELADKVMAALNHRTGTQPDR